MKAWHNNVFDNGLNHIDTNCNKMVLCKQPPTSFNEANNLDTDAPPGYKVAEVVMAAVDFTVQDRTGGGRECVVAAKSAPALDNSLGSDDLHVCLLNTATSEVTVITDETTDQVITTGNTVNIPSFTVFMPDPV